MQTESREDEELAMYSRRPTASLKCRNQPLSLSIAENRNVSAVKAIL